MMSLPMCVGCFWCLSHVRVVKLPNQEKSRLNQITRSPRDLEGRFSGWNKKGTQRYKSCSYSKGCHPVCV